MAGRDVELVFIVDESGSMHSLRSDTIGGLNSVLAEHREAGGEGDAYVTIVTFSNESRTRVEHVPIADVAELTAADYSPSGCTALLDAVGSTVEGLWKRIKVLPKGSRPDVIVVIITDGEENASHRYDNESVRRLVERRRKKGWEFVFLGANIDAFSAAGSIGIDRRHSSGYVSDEAGSATAYRAMSAATMSYRKSGAVADSWSAETSADVANRG